MSADHHPELLDTLAALLLVTALSLVGGISFALGRRLNTVVPFFLSGATGALLGTAFFHLIPEALENGGSTRRVGLLFAIGLIASFALERLLFIRSKGKAMPAELPKELKSAEAAGFLNLHSHSENNGGRSGSSLVANVLVGGGVHSFIDGVGIAAAFSSSHRAGVATTIAVLLHEIPHHIADIGVLLYSGVPRSRAMCLNLLATSPSLIGGSAVLALGAAAHWGASTLLPLTAASFLYVAIGLLMPELQREKSSRRFAFQILTLILVVFLMSKLGGEPS